MTTVAVLGTGDMGAAMVGALLHAGFGVRVWNRTASKAAALASEGAEAFDEPQTAVSGADVVIVMVFDAAAVLEALEQVSGDLKRDAVIVQSATVGLDIDTVASAAERYGIALVDAPVLGNMAAARAGRLTVLASGRPHLRAKVAPVLDALAAKVIWVGDHAGAASALKLVCNAWVLSLNAAGAQSIALARALGLNPRDFLTAVAGTPADSEYLNSKAAIMLGENKKVITPIDAVGKDLRHITDAAHQHDVSTLLLDSVAALYDVAVAAGSGDQDIAMVEQSFAGDSARTSRIVEV